MNLAAQPTLFELPRIERPDLTDEQARLVRALRYGRENARQVSDLAQAVGVRERRLQELVAELIEAGILVGTATTRPFGNYLIANEVERTEVVKLIEARARHERARAANLDSVDLDEHLERVRRVRS